MVKDSTRLQASLLERLTDHDPRATRESRVQRATSARALRQSVMRDLGWLLNARGIASVQDVGMYPHVADSVVNFGFADIVGKSASGTDTARIERLLYDAIRAFEPRILPGTLRVQAIQHEETTAQHDATVFSVEGDLYMQPVPERLYLRTELDLEVGQVTVTEQAGARR